jgi:hypothetical protein
MSIHLPKPIEIYFSSDQAGDAEALSSCFAPDATVHDEGRSYEGLKAIKTWRIEVKKKYDYTAEPIEAVESGGKTVVTGRVSGNFPGSPVNLRFIFALAGEKIASLEIRS